MNIAITGASGFVGKSLAHYFKQSKEDYYTISLYRDLFDEDMQEDLSLLLSECDVIINLAGAPIFKRWTKKYKEVMYDSRVLTTRRLVTALQHAGERPKLLISISAVGYYIEGGPYDEYTGKGDVDFLSDLCYHWEQEAQLVPSSIRLAIARLGLVLGAQGGVMKSIGNIAKYSKLGTIIGRGDQQLSFIAIEDLCRAIDFIISNESLHGVFNFVAPHATTQQELIRSIVKRYGGWATLKLPEMFFDSLLGERVKLITKRYEISPKRLIDNGFDFKYPTLKSYLKS